MSFEDNYESKVIVALDFKDRKEAISMAKLFTPKLCKIKIGLELFVSCGPSIIEELNSLGYKIFLDLKFHDITNTVIQSCIAASSLGVWMLNIHSSSGKNTMVNSKINLVNNNYPDICISMGPYEVAKMLLSSFGLYKKSILGNCLQIPIYEYGIKLVTKRFVKFIHSKGLKVCVWTINDEKTFKYLIDIGVDGIITDKPKLLFEVLDSATNQ